MSEDGETSRDEVGTVAEEAAKLFEALQGWAREASSGGSAGSTGSGGSGGSGDDAGAAADEQPGGPGGPQGEQAPGQAPPGEPSREQPGEPWAGIRAHLTDGGQECTWCPLCRTVALVRQTSPEVREHLADAASSLLAAGAAFLEDRAAAAGGAPDRGRDGSTEVERIDLDGDGAGWDAD